MPGINFTVKDKPLFGRAFFAVFLAASVGVFYLYAPLAYGNAWTKAECNKVKLFEKWDWDCNTFLDSYADYSLAIPAASGPAPTGSAAALHGPAPPVAEDPQKDVVVTPGSSLAGMQQPQGGVTEERIEYRDDQGNLLDEEQVKALEGKVSFSTRYETRTRLVDAQGNEIYNRVVGEGEEGGSVGTSADGPEPETVAEPRVGEKSTKPAEVHVEGDVAKEERLAAVTAEPESEAAAQTGKDEL